MTPIDALTPFYSPPTVFSKTLMKALQTSQVVGRGLFVLAEVVNGGVRGKTSIAYAQFPNVPGDMIPIALHNAGYAAAYITSQREPLIPILAPQLIGQRVLPGSASEASLISLQAKIVNIVQHLIGGADPFHDEYLDAGLSVFYKDIKRLCARVSVYVEKSNGHPTIKTIIIEDVRPAL